LSAYEFYSDNFGLGMLKYLVLLKALNELIILETKISIHNIFTNHIT